MKRPISLAIGLLALLLCAASTAIASPPVLEKSLRGAIAPGRLSLTLASMDCDATQAAIPNGSTLTAERFNMHAGENGLGTFSGIVRIVTPDGRTVARGLLLGTIGLAETSDPTNCVNPNRLEGMVHAVPVASANTTEAALMDAALAPPGFLLQFRANRIPQALEPLYEGRLYGLFAPIAPPPAVLVQTDRPEYGAKDPINAIVTNRSDRPIAAEDLKTDCTILWLQRRVEGGWKNVANCMIKRVTQTIVIPPGESLRVTLPGAEANGAGRDPGTYRLALEFRFQNPAPADDPATRAVFSPTFLIRGVTPPPPPGQVLVKPERLEYRGYETIRGIVANQTRQTIASLPTESYCTILSLERRAGDAWQPVGTCAYVREPDPVLIPAGASRIVSLPPGGQPAPTPPGLYRMVLTFRLLGPDNQPAGEPKQAISPEFRVVPGPPPSGYVRVNPGRPVYRSDEPIQASVTNLLRSAIQGNAWHSYCTILQLQRKVENGWALEGGCMLDGGPTITIPPGQTHHVLMPPKDSRWPNRPPGTYRLVLRYITVDPTTNRPAGDMSEAVSPSFQIGQAPVSVTLKVAPDKPAYAATNTLTAVLQNGASPVRVMDGNTMCTIVRLQKADEAGWTTVAPCLLEVASKPTILRPNQMLAVRLTRNAAWEPGRYRFAVFYSAVNTDGKPIGPERTALSAPFTVGLSNTLPLPVRTYRLPEL